MTLEEIKEEIKYELSLHSRRKDMREGQEVFNYIDGVYGVARIAQFEYGVDCFYDDTKIDEFIETCAKIIYNLQNEQSN